jgi:virulence-associated protein VapD
MTSPQIFTLCVKCLEPTCEHWDYKLVVHKQKSILSSIPIYLINIDIKCTCTSISTKLNFNTNYNDIKTILKPYRCNLCQNSFVISDREIPYDLAVLLKQSKKYPRSKCPQCKGDSEVLHETFAKCEDCEGTGGLVCTNCNGLWNICNNDNCIVGYSKRCYNCKGSKSVITDKEFWKVYPCDLCEQEE